MKALVSWSQPHIYGRDRDRYPVEMIGQLY
jgi:hypothetical protein